MPLLREYTTNGQIHYTWELEAQIYTDEKWLKKERK